MPPLIIDSMLTPISSPSPAAYKVAVKFGVVDCRTCRILIEPDQSCLQRKAHKSLYYPENSRPITVDGVLDETSWKASASTGPFQINHGSGYPEARVEAKMLWDDQNVYFGFECKDTDILRSG